MSVTPGGDIITVPEYNKNGVQVLRGSMHRSMEFAVFVFELTK